MTDLDVLRTGFVAFIDGLWWGLRENTGPLSMYEGYGNGFKQMGKEIAEAKGYHKELSAITNNIAVSHIDLSEFDIALDYFDQLILTLSDDQLKDRAIYLNRFFCNGNIYNGK